MRRVAKGTGFVFIVAAAFAAPPETDPEKLRRDTARIREAIMQLGDQEYRRREAAMNELREIGEPAIPSVHDATTSADPEIRMRAQELLTCMLRDAGKSRTTGMVLRPVLNGQFQMGSPGDERTRSEDEQLHRVRITRPFVVGVYEVTQYEFDKVMKRNPSWFKANGGGKEKLKGQDTSRFPVEQVSWFDALDFCNRLSELDGFKPYYQLAEVKRDKQDSITAADVKVLGSNGYRLPTEAEWEYACRGWTNTPFHHGVRSARGDLNAKIYIPGGGYGPPPETIDLGRTAEVGTHKRNSRGLFDMHGNVAEWCWDWYSKTYYEQSPVDDPQGPEKGTHRVLRGGSWLVNDTSCRSASRGALMPGERSYTTGFRVARTP